MPELSTVWFLLLGFLFAGYAVLDGFDLGAGILHLFVARTDLERRQVLNSIGPVWDGNEVWLITAGGALFAAFPIVYATVFSGFYLAMMLVLAALILRGISIEYRGKETATWWRTAWDVGFSVGSALVALLLGVALGNLLTGVPLDAGGVYRGGLIGLLNPFSLLVGVLTLALAAQQGASWLVLKTEGDLAERALKAQTVAQLVVLAAWLAATGFAFAGSLPAVDNFKSNAAAWIGPLLVANAIFFGFRATLMGQQFRAFICSSLHLLQPHDRLPGDHRGGGALPEPRSGRRAGAQPDRRQRPLFGADHAGHAGRGGARNADRDRLHVVHLLEVQGQGPAGRSQLLGKSPNRGAAKAPGS